MSLLSGFDSGLRSARYSDKTLLESLGLRTHSFGRDWTDLGTVTVDEARPEEGRPAATVRVEVVAMPAMFWRFTVLRPAEGVDGKGHAVYEPLERRVITTGSGDFGEYWPTAKLVAENMLDIEQPAAAPPPVAAPRRRRRRRHTLDEWGQTARVVWEGDGTFTPSCGVCAWAGKSRRTHSEAASAVRSHERSRRHFEKGRVA